MQYSCLKTFWHYWQRSSLSILQCLMILCKWWFSYEQRTLLMCLTCSLIIPSRFCKIHGDIVKKLEKDHLEYSIWVQSTNGMSKRALKNWKKSEPYSFRHLQTPNIFLTIKPDFTPCTYCNIRSLPRAFVRVKQSEKSNCCNIMVV